MKEDDGRKFIFLQTPNAFPMNISGEGISALWIT